MAVPSSAGAHAETRERLRRLIREIEARPASATAYASRPAAVEQIGGVAPEGWERRSTAVGTCSYRERRYPLTQRVGARTLEALRLAEGATLDVLARDAGAGDACASDLLFLDIETTGLGGAGAIAFLVATARLEGGAGTEQFVLRQYLAHSPAEEGALLEALLADARLEHDDPVLVTYNGRAFDAPMLDGRATLHRRRAGFEALRHLDLLMPVRSVYRGALDSCRLAVVEAAVLRVTRPSADVDGAEVPAWYFRYLRSGDMRLIVPIASHNAIDVLSLAGLTGHLAALVSRAEPARGAEALGLGRLYASGGDAKRAQDCFDLALDTLAAGAARREALMRLGLLHRRRGDHSLAEPLWWELAREGGAWSLHAHEELAKYYEHRARDLERALEVVERALVLVSNGLGARDPQHGLRWGAAFRYRRARLTSRMGRAAPAR